MLYLHTLLLPLGKFLTTFCLLLFELASQNIGIVRDKNRFNFTCKLPNSPLYITLLGFSKALACQCLKLAVVAVWIARWSRSHQKLLKRCQNFLRYISNGEVHTCNKCCKTKVAHNLIGLPSLFYKQFVHKSCTYTCIIAVLFKSTVSVLL